MTPPEASNATRTVPELPSIGPAFQAQAPSSQLVLKPGSVTELTLVLTWGPDPFEPETEELFPSRFEARPLPTVSPPALSRGPGGRSLVFFSEPTSPSNHSGRTEEPPPAGGKQSRSTNFFVHFPNSKVFGKPPKEQPRLAGVGELVVPPPSAGPESLAVEPLLFHVRRGGALSVLSEPTRTANDSNRKLRDFSRNGDELDLLPIVGEATTSNSVSSGGERVGPAPSTSASPSPSTGTAHERHPPERPTANRGLS